MPLVRLDALLLEAVKLSSHVHSRLRLALDKGIDLSAISSSIELRCLPRNLLVTAAAADLSLWPLSKDLDSFLPGRWLRLLADCGFVSMHLVFFLNSFYLGLVLTGFFQDCLLMEALEEAGVIPLPSLFLPLLKELFEFWSWFDLIEVIGHFYAVLGLPRWLFAACNP